MLGSHAFSVSEPRPWNLQPIKICSPISVTLFGFVLEGLSLLYHHRVLKFNLAPPPPSRDFDFHYSLMIFKLNLLF